MQRAIVVLAVLGCGGSDAGRPHDAGSDGPEVDPFEERSGTRLQRRGYEVGGTKLLPWIFDAVRAERCAPRAWSDGGHYCTPYERSGFVAYSDAACTKPIGIANKLDCSTEPLHFFEYDTSCESATHRMFTAGAPRVATAYYVRSGAGCEAHAASEYDAIHELGAEVLPAALAAVTVSEPVGTHRLRQRFYESADGLRFAAQVHDATLDGACQVIGAPSWACYPQNTLDASLYGDAACSTHVATDHGSCTPPRYAVYADQPACSLRSYELVELGPQRPANTAYRLAGPTCSAVTLGDRPTYALGAPIEMAIVTPSYPGTSRIRLEYASSEGDAFPLRNLFDADHHAPCGVRTAEDGMLRCLPVAIPFRRYYRDAACTNAIDLHRQYRGEASCAPPPRPHHTIEYVDAANGCTAKTRIRALGAEYTAPIFANDGVCSPVTDGSAIYYEVGATVPPAAFPAAITITE